jgi:hypothetical protein
MNALTDLVEDLSATIPPHILATMIRKGVLELEARKLELQLKKLLITFAMRMTYLYGDNQ